MIMMTKGDVNPVLIGVLQALAADGLPLCVITLFGLSPQPTRNAFYPTPQPRNFLFHRQAGKVRRGMATTVRLRLSPPAH